MGVREALEAEEAVVSPAPGGSSEEPAAGPLPTSWEDFLTFEKCDEMPFFTCRLRSAILHSLMGWDHVSSSGGYRIVVMLLRTLSGSSLVA